MRSSSRPQDGYNAVIDEKNPLDDDVNPLDKAGGMYAKLNWLKAGILAADTVLTVSPNYASEISNDPASGVELDSVIRQVCWKTLRGLRTCGRRVF